MTERVSAVLYARDMNRLLDFYCAVLDQRCVYRDAYHAVLRCGIFALDIHQLPSYSPQVTGDEARGAVEKGHTVASEASTLHVNTTHAESTHGGTAHAGTTHAEATRHRAHIAVKLSFPVDSIERARQAAAQHGGTLDAPPPRWVVEQQKICDGVDPEGNVFQLREDD
ncbi:MAG: VOC family protein [Gammaproteobacteria bacterium]